MSKLRAVQRRVERLRVAGRVGPRRAGSRGSAVRVAGSRVGSRRANSRRSAASGCACAELPRLPRPACVGAPTVRACGCAGPCARAARPQAVRARRRCEPRRLCGSGRVSDRGCAASGGAVGPGPYARPVRIDLHTHSTASDGTDTPAELVGRAKAAGLDVVAITDHDTAAGWAEAAAALPTGLTLVPGTEFSCAWFGANGARIGLHLLGYLYDSDDAELQSERRRLRESRRGRGQAIVNNLRADGIPVTWQRVAGLAGDGAWAGRTLARRSLKPAWWVRSTRLSPTCCHHGASTTSGRLTWMFSSPFA